jgi:uncharacterized protein (DUF433 family)
MDITQFIEIDQEKRFGKPILKGTRIAVTDVLHWLANGMSVEEIRNDFPELTTEHVRACLFFAASKEVQLGRAS